MDTSALFFFISLFAFGFLTQFLAKRMYKVPFNQYQLLRVISHSPKTEIELAQRLGRKLGGKVDHLKVREALNDLVEEGYVCVHWTLKSESKLKEAVGLYHISWEGSQLKSAYVNSVRRKKVPA